MTAKTPVQIQVTFDALDPAAQARFWAEALGYEVEGPPDGFGSWPAFLKHHGVPETDWDRLASAIDPSGKGPRLFFQRVDDAKKEPNRIHLDLMVSGGPSAPLEERKRRIEAEAERLVALGGSRKRVVERGAEFWIVMRDPEGNEFCLE